MWLSSNIERKRFQLEERSIAGVCKSTRKRRILVRSCGGVTYEDLVCRSWGPVSQSNRPSCSRTSHLTWTKVTPNRGRGDAHIAGHSKCYLSSARDGFCTVACRGQLCSGWVFRSASEGTSNVTLKSSSGIHPLPLPWFLVMH